MASEELSLDDLFGSEEDPPDTRSHYVCSSCGHKFVVEQKLKFCSQCGSRVGEVSRTVEVDTRPRTRVLLVDDSKIALRKVSSILQNLHCDVTEAENGTVAMSLAKGLQPQLVVLDVHMPKISGLQVLEALRQNPAFATTPIVMMTGDADAAIVSQAITLKATDYIRKDDSVANITSRLQAHLEKLHG
jgi:two-component system, chemotaxis family, chemotaxis protein CheY